MIKKISAKLQARFQKPKPGDIRYVLLESKHPDNPPRRIPEHLLHPSVYEPNHPHDAPNQFAFEKAVFSWIAPEYHQHPKSVRWWAGFAIISVLAMILEGISGNWTMFLATVAFIAVYWSMHEFYPPKYVKIVISEFGLKIGNRKIPYAQVENFWILFNPPHLKQLCFRVKGAIFSDLILELEEENPAEIRQFLRRHLKEIENTKESWVDLLVRILKF